MDRDLRGRVPRGGKIVTRTLKRFWLACGALLILATAASAQEDDEAEPSFDCAAATAPMEALICADTSLADLDRKLAESYHALLATRVGEAQMLLREEQRAWAESRAASCGVEGDPAIEEDDAIGCLIALYRARIAELQPGQGGNRAAAVGLWLADGRLVRRRDPQGADRSQARGCSAGAAWPHHALRGRAGFDPRRRQLFLSALQRRASTEPAIRRSQRLSHRRDGPVVLRGYCLVGCSALD